MARGGREGSGRKKGKTLKLLELLNKKQVSEFVQYVLTNYQKDTRLATWMGDHIFGKAPQAITGPDGGPIKVESVEVRFKKK